MNQTLSRKHPSLSSRKITMLTAENLSGSIYSAKHHSSSASLNLTSQVNPQNSHCHFHSSDVKIDTERTITI